MKEDIIQQIDKYLKNVIELPDEKVIIDIEGKIDAYHETHPLDVELIIYESLILLIPPLSDYLKSLELLEKIDTLETVILKSEIQYLNQGFIDLKYQDQLHQYLSKANDAKQKAILYFLLSEGTNDQSKKMEYLDQSIKLNPNNALSYSVMAKLYQSKDKEKNKYYQKKALDNVVEVIKENDKSNFADYNSFIDEHILGIRITDVLFEIWQERYNN